MVMFRNTVSVRIGFLTSGLETDIFGFEKVSRNLCLDLRWGVGKATNASSFPKSRDNGRLATRVCVVLPLAEDTYMLAFRITILKSSAAVLKDCVLPFIDLKAKLERDRFQHR